MPRCDRISKGLKNSGSTTSNAVTASLSVCQKEPASGSGSKNPGCSTLAFGAIQPAQPFLKSAKFFGAGVQPDHTPSPYLKLRVETAVDLYKAGRVKSLLMSGNNSDSHHNETTVMKAYAVGLGVNPAAIMVDPDGFNTHDTCYRAHSAYHINSATVVTQSYHLPRAVMTCLQSGIDTVGVAAKSTGRDWTVLYVVREFFATGKAYAQALIHSQPTLVSTVKTTTQTN